MKYLKQFAILLGVCLLGELTKFCLPFPIPSSVYGLVLLLIFLKLRIIKLEQVEGGAEFLIQIMPIMFVPAAVGLMDIWSEIVPILMPLGIILLLITALVMAVTGNVAQWIIKGDKKRI